MPQKGRYSKNAKLLILKKTKKPVKLNKLVKPVINENAKKYKKKSKKNNVTLKTKSRPKKIENNGNNLWLVRFIPALIRQYGYLLVSLDDNVPYRNKNWKNGLGWTLRDTEILMNIASKGFTLLLAASIMNVTVYKINTVCKAYNFKNYSQFSKHFRQTFVNKYKDILYYKGFLCGLPWAIKFIGLRLIYNDVVGGNNNNLPVLIILDLENLDINKQYESNTEEE